MICIIVIINLHYLAVWLKKIGGSVRCALGREVCAWQRGGWHHMLAEVYTGTLSGLFQVLDSLANVASFLPEYTLQCSDMGDMTLEYRGSSDPHSTPMARIKAYLRLGLYWHFPSPCLAFSIYVRAPPMFFYPILSAHL